MRQRGLFGPVALAGRLSLQICRTRADVVVHTPAKLNLFFEVLGKRSDGYHEIETLMCPVDVYDTLLFKEDTDGRIALECRGAAVGCDRQGSSLFDLPPSAENLVVRALALLRARAGTQAGARVTLLKRIPLAAGLGGGSSDAAAALAAANLGWRLGWSREALMAVAAELGSDVPFFLAGGAAICRGRGERIEPVAGMGGLHFVVVRPPAGLATASVYRACRPAEEPHRVEPLLTALREGRLEVVARSLFNRLQPAAESLSPWIRQLEEVFSRFDCLGHAMSGSGSAYYGLCCHSAQARRLAHRLRALGIGVALAARSCR